MQKTRDYSNLRETERVWEAVKINSTHIKDYSLKHIVSVAWQFDETSTRKRLVIIKIGDQKGLYNTLELNDTVLGLANRDDDNGWLPRDRVMVENLAIDTTSVNFECLRDHMAEVTIGKNTAILDLEELLKAIRYA